MWDKKSGEFFDRDDFAIDPDGTLVVRRFSDLYNDTWLDPQDEGLYIIEQFTGLKDKNGIEIYEGDIIKIIGHEFILANDQREEDTRYEVKWDKMGFCFTLLDGFFMHGCGRIGKPEYEVAGNIHE